MISTSGHVRSAVVKLCVKCGKRWPCPTRKEELIEERAKDKQ